MVGILELVTGLFVAEDKPPSERPRILFVTVPGVALLRFTLSEGCRRVEVVGGDLVVGVTPRPYVPFATDLGRRRADRIEPVAFGGTAASGFGVLLLAIALAGGASSVGRDSSTSKTCPRLGVAAAIWSGMVDIG